MNKTLIFLICLSCIFHISNATEGTVPPIDNCINNADKIFVGFIYNSSVNNPIELGMTWKGKTQILVKEVFKGNLNLNDKIEVYTEFQPGNRFAHLLVGKHYYIFTKYNKNLGEYVVYKYGGTNHNLKSEELEKLEMLKEK